MESKRKPEDVTLELKGNEVISGKSRTSSEKKVVSEAEATNLCDALQSDTVSTNFDEQQQDSAADASSVDNARAVTFKKPGASLGAKRSRQTSKCCDASVCSSASGTEVGSREDHDRLSVDVAVKFEEHSQEQQPPFPYVEPHWGGNPEPGYAVEVLKCGVIVETISLAERSFYVVGRLPSCHLSFAHPTISRYHAILQYRSQEGNENPKGFYVYDLGSTHGTFWNGNRIKANVYVRIRGGHMLRFGCSQRKYILQAPPADREEESEFSLTELKEMRAVELEKRRAEKDAEKCTREKESEGIDWGMGEDADEETDLQENPYACVTDEDLILEDPKKTLRGWFEREGYDLRYQTEEKGVGQFLCWIDLPTEDIVGRRTRAEALVKGKKKEAVVQCALEACKVLDKYGLLRQANHEARKRKARDWEAEDYYDSDEDNFLDRTGSIERKREQRMRLAGRLEEKVETYGSLLEKHKQVAKRISHLSNSIKSWQNASSASKETTEEDALDAFMSSLSSSALTKTDVAKMKLELQNLRKEEASLTKLLNLTRPANLPALSARDSAHEDEASAAAAVPRQSGNLPASLLRGKMNARQRKQTNKRAAGDSKPLLSNAVSDATVETASMEEVDSDDNDDDNDDKDESTWNWRMTKEERVQAKGRLDSSERQEKREQVRGTKKRRQEEKMPCDQVAYADNYSMWVPPKGQAGDGKTSLNEKYGY